jgi:hypothetical protein
VVSDERVHVQTRIPTDLAEWMDRFGASLGYTRPQFAAWLLRYGQQHMLAQVDDVAGDGSPEEPLTPVSLVPVNEDDDHW